jgi:hypothetical protein
LKGCATKPPPVRAVKDEVVLQAYSVWLADPEKAISLFREQERLHEGKLRRYEKIGAWMEEERGEDLDNPDSPASSATRPCVAAPSKSAGTPSGAAGSPTVSRGTPAGRRLRPLRACGARRILPHRLGGCFVLAILAPRVRKTNLASRNPQA